MERLFHSFLLISLSLILWSCHKDETGGGNTPKPSPSPSGQTITISDTSPTVSCEGNEVKIEFTVSEAWTADIINTRADTWVSVSPKSGNAGAITMSISVNPNDTYDERGATIRIICGSTSKDIILTQKQKDAVVVTPSRNEFGAEGGKFSIEVKANVSYEYQIEEGCRDWIKDMTTKGLTSRTISFEVSENKKLAKREGSIIVNSSSGNEVVKIYQNGETPAIILTKNEYVVASEGETIQVEVRSNVNVSVEIPSDCGWISESNTKSMSTSTFNFIVSANTGYDERAAEIKFTNNANNVSETVKITQLQKDAIIIADNEYEFTEEGGVLELEVKTNVKLFITISDNAKSWITYSGTKALSSEKLYFTISPYYSSDERTGTIIISNGNIKKDILVHQYLQYKGQYLHFSGYGNSISLRNELGNIPDTGPYLEYSYDKKTWKKWDYNWLELTVNGLYLRGDNPDGIQSSPYDYVTPQKYSKFVTLWDNIPIECDGDIMSLISYKKKLYAIPDGNFCFYCLFQYLRTLKSGPQLPAIKLNPGCYESMFEGCSLVEAPELPAVELASECYKNMFKGCEKLTTAPELPAAELSKGCYYGMFSKCTGLSKIPVLSATKMANDCYREMFKGCTKLATAPKLPATELSEGCYYGMFSECTKMSIPPKLPATKLSDCCYSAMFENSGLTKAPELPATEMTDECYREMFSGCRSLTEAPELPATSLAQGCYYGMFSECTKMSIPPKLPATKLSDRCYSAMFENSGLTKAPELPAISLATQCYMSMFSNCIKLLKAPKLPATSLAQGCYGNMFQYCTSLIAAPELTSITLASDCYDLMFRNCTSLTEAPELPATLLAPRCYSSMFSNCTNLSNAPELPAITLAPNCYSSMFSGCTNLSVAPELPATNLASQCYDSMFFGCTKLSDAPELPAINLKDYCYHNMFCSCTGLKTVPCLPATVLVNGCYKNMFERCSSLSYVKSMNITAPANIYTGDWLLGVSSSGSFVKNSASSWDLRGATGIPEGWTVKYESK